MNEWRYAPTTRHDVVTIPVLWLAIVLSLLVHTGALLLLLDRLELRNLTNDIADLTQKNTSLAVQLEPPAKASSEPAPPPSAASAPTPPVVASVEPPRRPPPPR
ncbi:MAG TPA: hypothetical protein VMV45_06340, partial [Casimicrobiaceae bacterium]|nr:hypothetical protein [Casimicrobiaceae bacterium]